MGFDPFLMREWVAALRSGDYVQGKNYLKCSNHLDEEDYTYCCLGVLADIVNPNAWKFPPVVYAGAGLRWHDQYMTLSPYKGTPDNPEIRWANSLLQDNITAYGGDYDCGYDIESTLMKMNDSGWTFEEIADAIEVMIP